MRISKKILALLLAITLTVSAAPLTFAASSIYTDVPSTHWAYDAISTWSTGENAILFGDGKGNFFPDNSVADVELDLILGRILGNAGDWSPSDSITREEAVARVARTLGVAPATDGQNLFADDAAIASQYKPYIYGMKARGYVVGVGGNAFSPKSTLTRAEIVTITQKVISAVTDKNVSGETYANDLVVRKAGVTVKEAVVNGDLIIGQGVGDGDVWLDGVTVKGSLLVYGGGSNSIHIRGNSAIPNVIINKAPGAGSERVSVKVEGAVSIPLVRVIGGTVEVHGNVANLVIDAPNAVVVLAPGATVGNLIISETAAGASVQVQAGATVTSANINADDVNITGTGTVKSVTIAEDVTGSTVTVPTGTTGTTTGGGSSGGGTGGNNNNNATASTLAELQAILDDTQTIVRLVYLAADITIHSGEELVIPNQKEVRIPSGRTLTVEPGGTVTILSTNSGDTRLQVNYGGTLVMSGTVTGRVFVVVKTTEEIIAAFAESYVTDVFLEESLTLTADLEIPANKRLHMGINYTTGEPTTLTVPFGKILTVSGDYYAAGSVLNNEGSIAVNDSGNLGVQTGTKQDGTIVVGRFTGEGSVTVNGNGNLFLAVGTDADLRNLLTKSYVTALTVSGEISLASDLIIPAGKQISVNADHNDSLDTLTQSKLIIPSGKTLTIADQGQLNISGGILSNNGTVDVNGQIYAGIMFHSGVLSVWQIDGGGTINRGANGRVYVTATTEAELASALSKSYVDFVMVSGAGGNNVTLTSGLTIPSGKQVSVSATSFGGAPTADSLIIPSGVTLTVNGQLSIGTNTYNNVTAKGELINNGTIVVSGTQESQAYVSITGTFSGGGVNIIDGQYSRFSMSVYDEAELVSALAKSYVTYISIAGDVTLNQNAEIPAGQQVSVSSYYAGNTSKAASLTVAAGNTLTVSGRLYVSTSGTLTVDGTVDVSQGGYVSNSGGTIDGAGSITGAGSYPTYP